MPLLNVRKGEDSTTVTLPAELIESLHLAENDTIAWEASGNQVILRRAEETSASMDREQNPPSLAELMKLPLEDRHQLLAQAAAEAAGEFRKNSELMEFSAALDGEDWEETNG